MQIARVVGTVVATQKNGKLEGAKLLLIQPLDGDRPRGTALLAIDSVGAGIGERVLVVLEGRAAGEAMRRKGAPVDAAILGIVDAVDLMPEPGPSDAAPSSPRPPGAPDVRSSRPRRRPAGTS
jgi:ethanolamine utilization protein EutN